MKPLFLFLVTLSLLISCKEKISDEIVIEGYVKNLPDGKIYLTEAHKWFIPLDTTECRDGHFIFRITPDSSFMPYMAAIHFPDSNMQTKVGSLFFRNYMLGADSMKYSGGAFYLEKGYTRIEGDNKAKPFLRVFAGKETDVMYKNQFTDLGWLGNLDSAQRSAKVELFKKEVKEYPFSYYLYECIYSAKEQYSEKQLQEILSLFNPDMHKSKLGIQMKTYLVNRPDLTKPYPNLSLLNSDKQRQFIIDSSAKLNMLVFWASWCGPCRLEIPLLKDIQKKYGHHGLRLVNISIDEDTSKWEKALSEERMSWPQYHVENAKIIEIMQQFNFSSIPLVVFTDKMGMEVERVSGYYKENNEKYEAIISKFCK